MGSLEDLLNTGTPIGITGDTDLSFILNGRLPSNSVYAKNNHSYSGCDIRAVVTDSRTGSSRIIGNLATISYSIHREKMPVRSLGRTYPKAFTRGQRTIAGTLVFTIFDRYALYDVASVKSKYDRGVGESAHSLLGDQMAPFDVYCLFQNELGDISQLNIYGIELIDEGQVMSINDIFTESTHSYVAQDIDVMFPLGLGPIQEAPSLANPVSIFRFDSAANTAVPDKAPNSTVKDFVVPGPPNQGQQ